MALLSIANLQLSHGDRSILSGASLTIERGQRIGMVGRNGCGKTTLMRILNGQLKPDDGQVQLSRGIRVGYLAQDPDLDSDRTLRREADAAFAELAALHKQLDDLSHELADASGEQLERLMKRYESLEHEIEAAGGYAVDHRIDATLHGLGLGDETFSVPVSGLSGGQKARLAMAKLLLSEPDLLLLDEPTNHLDIAGRQWLEQFLKSYPGSIMLVSHDRWLLDEVADRIIEIDRGKIIEYPGNYTAYREQRATRRLEQQRVYDRQQTYIRQQKQYIDRYKTGQRAKEARGRQKKLERFIRDEVIENVSTEKVMKLNLPRPKRSGDIVITADAVAKRYDDKVLVHDFHTVIKRGQRIGVIGPNGCGKSTLMRMLIERGQADSGKTRLGAQVSIGYYHQTHEYLDDEDTPVTFLQRHVPDHADQSARDLAGAFLFSGDDQDKPFGVLSGGERTRAVLASLMVGGHNVLVLDEPSNHLDIPSAERLEQALGEYEGTLLLITHDRRLLQDTVDELLVFEGGGRVRHFIGTYADWLNVQRQAEAEDRAVAVQQETKPKPVAKSSAKPQAARPAKTQAAKLTKGKLWHLSDEKLEAKVEQLTQQIAALDEQLADPDLYQDPKAFNEVLAKRQAAADELEPLEEEWLTRADSE
jgi:ATP-binding cassette subfamily F protein 3